MTANSFRSASQLHEQRPAARQRLRLPDGPCRGRRHRAHTPLSGGDQTRRRSLRPVRYEDLPDGPRSISRSSMPTAPQDRPSRAPPRSSHAASSSWSRPIGSGTSGYARRHCFEASASADRMICSQGTRHSSLRRMLCRPTVVRSIYTPPGGGWNHGSYSTNESQLSRNRS